MATNIQQPVGFIDRGSNAMARMFSRNANSRPPTQEQGMLEATKTPNSGTTPGTGAPTVVQKPNPTYRGTTLNSNMVTGKSTGLASRASTQRGNPSHYKHHYRKYKQTNDVRYTMNVEQMAATENYKKRRAYTANLTDNSLFAKYTGTTDYAFDLDNGDIKYKNVNAFIAQNCSNNGLSKDNDNQSSTNAPGASMAGDDTADIRSYKSQLSNKRNEHAKKLIVDAKDAEATVQCWEDGVVYAERLIIAKTGYFINFAKVHPVSFTARFGKIKDIPIWNGIMMFANIYSKPKAHYPSNLLAMFGNNRAKAKEALYGTVFINSNNEVVHVKGIACLIQERIPQVDKYRFTCYKMTCNLFDLSRTIINTISKLSSMLGVGPEKSIEAYRAKVEKVVSWDYKSDKLDDAKALLINLITLYGVDYMDEGQLHSVAGPIMASIQKLFDTTPLNEAKEEDTMKTTAELVKANDAQNGE